MHPAAWIPLFWLAAPAAAIPLDKLIPTYEVGYAGDPAGSRQAEARGVALDPTGEVVVAGWISGASGPLDEDGWVGRYDESGAPLFDTIVDGGPVSDTLPHSIDRLYGVALTEDGDPVVVGTVAGDLDAPSVHYTARLGPTGELLWESTFRDGPNSPLQEARAVAVHPATGRVVTAGWSYRNPTIAGQWVLRRHNGPSGAVQAGPIYYDDDAHELAPDQAFAVGVQSDGAVVIAGAAGIDSGDDPSGALADRDWLVRKLDPTLGTVLWEHTWGGAAGLEDAPAALVIDGAGNLVVVGRTNTGTDNHDGSSFAWRVVKYAGASGSPMWEQEWTSGPGHDTRATSVTFDATGNLIVGGTWSDGGVEAWRVARLSYFDGSLLDERTWPATMSDSVLHDLALRDGRLALAGTDGTAHGSVAVLRVFDLDSDGDGVADRFEECPHDAAKLSPGACGCGRPDIDTDGDGVFDCHDHCPQNPEKSDSPGFCGCHAPDTDSDGDGVPDCIDACPQNPEKSELGVCGCEMADDDPDGDGVLTCLDACPDTPAGAEVDELGCSEEQRQATPQDEPDPQTPPPAQRAGGCGCATGTMGGSGWMAWMALALGLALRRRR